MNIIEAMKSKYIERKLNNGLVEIKTLAHSIFWKEHYFIVLTVTIYRMLKQQQ